MNIARQHIVRAGVCTCGCHGKYHPTSCHRTVHDVFEHVQRDAYPGIPATLDGGRYVTDARGWVRYAGEPRTVRRIRYRSVDGLLVNDGFWAV
jgi:hypothetical protein